MNELDLELTPAQTLQKMKHTALRLLTSRDHSQLELRKKIYQRYKPSDDLWQSLLEWLLMHKYLADESGLSQKYAEKWRGEGRGRFWISSKLKEKGLPPVNLQDDEAEQAAALSLLQRKRLGGVDRPDRKAQGRIARTLASRGFSGTIIAYCLKNPSLID